MSTWRIKSSLEEWESVANVIEDELFSFGFSQKFIISIMLAMDEVIANITTYAYEGSDGDVIVESGYDARNGERTAKIRFIDFGKEFNPTKNIKEPDVYEKVAIKKEIGGLGIFLIKKQVDQIKYSYINDSNNLTLIKKEMV